MTKPEGVGTGSSQTSDWVVCGLALAGLALLKRRIRVLERRIDAVARKAELARQDADLRLRALEARGAAADLADLQGVRDTVRQMIGRAEDARRAYDAPPSQE